ncbi:MAG: hypothetical protein WAV15_04615 [Minisyncoccia bacterium]
MPRDDDVVTERVVFCFSYSCETAHGVIPSQPKVISCLNTSRQNYPFRQGLLASSYSSSSSLRKDFWCMCARLRISSSNWSTQLDDTSPDSVMGFLREFFTINSPTCLWTELTGSYQTSWHDKYSPRGSSGVSSFML